LKGLVLGTFAKQHIEGDVGLPKWPVSEAIITLEGVIGDYNAYRRRKFNNTPDRALLIMPIETLHDLQAEGYPVNPGDLGENITTEGIAYNEFTIGKQYRMGTVVFEITQASAPCKNIRTLPYGSADFVKALIGRRGWYAKVLKEGSVSPGDSIEDI
jgi:MOSC domain-containing protein YiiM